MAKVTKLDRLLVAHARTASEIEFELNRLRCGCLHKHVYYCETPAGAYRWACARCYVEHHAYALHGAMVAKTETPISWQQFIKRRAPGRLHYTTVAVEGGWLHGGRLSRAYLASHGT